MIFEEARRPLLEADGCFEMIPHWSGGHGQQAIVEGFVVGVVKALLLKLPFEVPVRLGEEKKTEILLSGLGNCSWPKRLRPYSPRSLKDFR